MSQRHNRAVRDGGPAGRPPAYLLDVNVLIALLDPAHLHHEAAHDWFGREVSLWASCPLTENGALRIMAHPKYTNPVDSVAEGMLLLARFCEGRNHIFWPCDESVLHWASLDARKLLRHAQLTDTYLLALAVQHGGKLATFDRRLVTAAVRDGAAALHVIK